MKLVILSIFTVFFYVCGTAQNQCIIFFKDKGTASKTFLNQFSQRSIDRRTKFNIPFDFKDFPVNAEYVKQLSQFGKVKSISRWLNAAVVDVSISKDQLKQQFSFISKTVEIKSSDVSRIEKEEFMQEKAISYGASAEQITQLNLDCLHDLGFQGEGVYLGVIDAGFSNMNNIDYFDSIYNDNRVIETFDFVNNNTNVYGFSAHGTGVSSCIVAQNTTPIVYYGTAVDLDIALYRSEDADTETIEEEFNLVLALERCDEQGIDIANISLGYVDFDDQNDNHAYFDLDGETTIAAIGVNTAASKGIAVVAAAGNSGPSTISTPCDADSVLCVGAVNNNGDYALFSSVGPSADGQIKPDVVARGENAAVVYDAGEVILANGTSFASPIMCGATACLMQAHPSRTPMDIFKAIRQSASQFTMPNGQMGYGIPDMCVANDLLTATTTVQEMSDLNVVLFPNPTKDFLTIKGLVNGKELEVKLVSTMGQVILQESSKIVQGMSMLDIRTLNSGVYFIEMTVDGTLSGVEKITVLR